MVLLTLAPTVAAIWGLPYFVTQDGPAHVYNAHVLLDLLRRGEDSPFAKAYEVRIDPVPNWAGHLALMATLSVADIPRTADRLVMSITLVVPALLLLGLCRAVGGRPPSVVEGLAAAVLSLNFLWLLGFYSFLLGVSATLAAWWHAWHGWTRTRLGLGWIAGLAVLLVLGYFCHPISLAAAVLGLGVLGYGIAPEGRARRLRRTALALMPLVPLGLIYRGLVSGGGDLAPSWENLKGSSALTAWASHLLWVDPLTASRRNRLPWIDLTSSWLVLLAPVAWLGIGLLLRLLLCRPSTAAARSWLVLAALLGVGGLVAPDTLGKSHGFYLGQRLVLMGLMALLPALSVGELSRVGGRLSRLTHLIAPVLVLAAVLQSAAVLEYAFDANRKIQVYLRAAPAIGVNRRIAGLVLRSGSPFRANALWHADTLLGLGTGNIVWSNYESAHYYFPVRVRDAVPHPPIEEFEEISRLDAEADQPERLARWTRLINDHHAEIDALAIWGDDPTMDVALRPWYAPVRVTGERRVRVWRRREPEAKSPPIP